MLLPYHASYADAECWHSSPNQFTDRMNPPRILSGVGASFQTIPLGLVLLQSKWGSVSHQKDIKRIITATLMVNRSESHVSFVFRRQIERNEWRYLLIKWSERSMNSIVFAFLPLDEQHSAKRHIAFHTCENCAISTTRRKMWGNAVLNTRTHYETYFPFFC